MNTEENRILSSSKLFYDLGYRVLNLIKFSGGFGVLSANMFKELGTRPFYARLVIEQIFDIGVKSFLLVAVTGLATGCVMALQFGFGLAKKELST